MNGEVTMIMRTSKNKLIISYRHLKNHHEYSNQANICVKSSITSLYYGLMKLNKVFKHSHLSKLDITF